MSHKVRTILFTLLMLFIALLFVMLLSVMARSDAPSLDISQQGLLDYRTWDGDSILSVDGNWLFFWNTLFTAPSERPEGIEPFSTHSLGGWHRAVKDQAAIPATGFGTYHVRILLPPETGTRAVLRMTGFHSPSNIYVNGDRIYSNGDVGTTAEESRLGEYGPAIREITSVDGVYDIVVQVANFSLPSVNAFPPIALTSLDRALEREFTSTLLETMVLTFLLTGMIYHLLVGAADANNRKFLLFGLFNLGPMLFLLVNSNMILARVGVPWEVMMDIHFTSRIFSIYMFLLYTAEFYSIKFIPRGRHLLHILFTGFMAVLILTPHSIQMRLYYPSLLLILGAAFFSLAASVNRMLKGDRLAIPFTISALFFIIASLYDVFGPRPPWAFFCCSYTVIGALLFGVIQTGLLVSVVRMHMHQVEDLVIQRTEEIEKMLWAQEKHARMGEIMNFVAHQWQQYLYTISLYVEGIGKPGDSTTTEEKVSQYLPVIKKSIASMFTTLKNFREFLSPKTSREHFSISDQCDKVLNMLSDLFSARGIRVMFDSQGDTMVYGNTNEFEQVLINLIGNATNILEERSIESPRIAISVDGRSENITLRIEDNGGGVSRQLRPTLFQSYKTDRPEGSGLGLYMSNRIVSERFRGTLSYEDGQEGACFFLELPRGQRPEKTGT